MGSLDIDPTGLLRACGAHARRVWAAEQPATPCSTRVSSHGAKAAMLLVVKIDVSALAGTKMRMRAFCARIEPYRFPSLAVSPALHALHLPCVRACVLARYLDERAGSGRLGGRSGRFAVPSPAPPCSRQRAPRWPPPSLMSMLRWCTLVHIASLQRSCELMNAFCRTDWELPISLSRNFSKLVSAAMSLPLIALRWPPFP